MPRKWGNMFNRKRKQPQSTEKRLTDIERRLSRLETERATDSKLTLQNTTPILFRDSPDTPDRKQLVPAFQPAIVKLNEQLTSFDFAVKSQYGQAALIGLACAGAGGVAALIFDMIWYAPLVIGVSGFAIASGALILDHRSLVHKTVDLASKPKANSQSTLNLNISGSNPNNPNAMDRLSIQADVSPEQIKKFATEVSRGVTLAVNHWCGAGSLFTRNQYDSLMAELILMNYVKPSSGNIPRQLSKKGKALIRALVE